MIREMKLFPLYINLLYMKNDLGKKKKVGYIICEIKEYHFALIKDLSCLLSYRNKNKMTF